jgi:hypothetical protein
MKVRTSAVDHPRGPDLLNSDPEKLRDGGPAQARVRHAA